MNDFKRLLIITYYWPPSAGAGVQRWLKFSKYLREFGWEPVIYTPLNPEYPGTDYSLQRDIPNGIKVVKRKIREPYHLYKLFTGKSRKQKVQAGFISESRKPGLLESIAVWLRGNLFIPDARKWWIKPSVQFLKTWLQENNIDAMVSTGPPHSMHLIALGIKKNYPGIPWIADFRDPWTQIDFYHHLRLSNYADKKHKALEKEVLETADEIITVSHNCAIGLRDISHRNIEVITNGFDESEFSNLKAFDYNKFSITHLGSMNADRNPVTLWKVLGQLVREDDFFRDNLQIRLIGKTDIRVTEALKENGLSSFTKNLQYLPHDQAIERASESAILLLPLNDTPFVLGIAPGKLYEYLAMKRPVLCIGPQQGDAASIIAETNSGFTVDFKEEEKTRQILLYWKNKFELQDLENKAGPIDSYSRKNLTSRLSLILNRLEQDAKS